MSGAASAAHFGFAVSSAREQPGEWLAWLDRHIDPGWRPGEWHHDVWLFDGDLDNDRTIGWACESCRRPIRGRAPLCNSCTEGRKPTPGRTPDRQRWALPEAGCVVAGCPREVAVRGICYGHTHRWGAAKVQDPTVIWLDWLAAQRPLPRPGDCIVVGCIREQMTANGLCRPHYDRLGRGRRVASLTQSEVLEWASGQLPFQTVNQFSLAGMTEIARREMLYSLQQRDRGPTPVDPTSVRGLAARLARLESLQDVDVESVVSAMGQNTATCGLLRDLRRHVDRANLTFRGGDPTTGDVWDLRLLDLHSAANRRYAATQGTIDFAGVDQVWLRELLKEWARSVRPNVVRLRNALQAAIVASFALTLRGSEQP